MERRRSSRRRQKQPFAQRAKEHCRQFTAFMFSNVGIIILVVIYMIGGASMFKAIEGDEAKERFEEMSRIRISLARKLWNISCCELNGFNQSAYLDEVGRRIHAYQELIVRNGRKGWSGGKSMVDSHEQWSFSGSLLFSLTVITTIGYGNIAPRTAEGKIATICYAIIGMPLFLLYLSNIGDIMAKSFKWIYAKVCLCRICPGVAKRRAIRAKRKIRAMTMDRRSMEGSMDDPYSEEETETVTSESISAYSDEFSESLDESSQESAEDTSTVTVPIMICLLIMIGYIFIGATIFRGWEDWGNLDGCYFCFISLSSIGFGDIVPGDKIMQVAKGNKSGVEIRFIMCAIYLLLGMALIAMCFNLMQEQVIFKLRSIKRGIRRCFRCDRCRCTS